MNNEELKEKIAAIIETAFNNRCHKTNCQDCDFYPDEMCQPNMYADALIAAGIGDVSEWKHRAEVAEKIAREACEIVFCGAIDNEEWDEVIRNYKETKEKYSDEFGITDEMLYDYLHEKAEKKLQEEGKDAE